ncbi:MAG: hypothetical protein ABIX10_15075 [Acidimicrobiales bacterium]
MLVPLVVMAPLVALAPTADHRFHVYLHGARYRDNPLRLVGDSFTTVPKFLELGNFRPIGRCLERLVDLAAFVLMDLLGLQANVALRLVTLAAAAVLSVLAMLFTECFLARDRVFAQRPSTLAAAVPFAVGAGFVASGPTSPAVLFGGLYMLSTSLVLGVAALALRATSVTSARVGPRRAVLLVVAGVGLASFNEIAYFALPVATVAVFARGRFVLDRSWREVLSLSGTRLVGWLWLGFTPVFLVTRGIIYSNCHKGGCYTGSDLGLDADVLVALPNRLVSWLPPFMWQTAGRDGGPSLLAGLLPLVAILLLGWLALGAARDQARLAPVARVPSLGFAAVAGVLLILGAALGAFNEEVQRRITVGDWGLGWGWRDTAMSTVAGGLATVGLLGGIVPPRWRGRNQVFAAVIVLLAMTAAVSTSANRGYHEIASRQPELLLANRIAHEMADFDRSAVGNDRRCGLRSEFIRLNPAAVNPLRRLDEALDTLSMADEDVPFCDARPPDPGER